MEISLVIFIFECRTNAVISKGKASRSVEIKFLSCGQSQRFVTASLSELGLESWRIT